MKLMKKEHKWRDFWLTWYIISGLGYSGLWSFPFLRTLLDQKFDRVFNILLSGVILWPTNFFLGIQFLTQCIAGHVAPPPTGWSILMMGIILLLPLLAYLITYRIIYTRLPRSIRDLLMIEELSEKIKEIKNSENLVDLDKKVLPLGIYLSLLICVFLRFIPLGEYRVWLGVSHQFVFLTGLFPWDVFLLYPNTFVYGKTYFPSLEFNLATFFLLVISSLNHFSKKAIIGTISRVLGGCSLIFIYASVVRLLLVHPFNLGDFRLIIYPLNYFLIFFLLLGICIIIIGSLIPIPFIKVYYRYRNHLKPE
ncbi:MAG: hypothetical protein ACFFAE_07610 [Candidatus Hodarchaeota archaeon]